MIVKSGRFGKFAACPNYPGCKNTKPLEENKPAPKADKKPVVETDLVCEKCGAPMVLRSGKFGSFYACSNFPKCRNTKQITKEIDVPCPKCGAKIVQKHGKSKSVFYSCERYPDCDFSSWDMPTGEKCPTCGAILLQKKGKDQLVCSNKACSYKRGKNEQ